MMENKSKHPDQDLEQVTDQIADRSPLLLDQTKVAASFEKEEPISHPIFAHGLYDNPWDTWQKPSLAKAFKYGISTLVNRPALPTKKDMDEKIPVLQPDWQKIRHPPEGEIQVTWLGHASFFVQMDGLNILTDPVWSDRCSPVSWLGPNRYRQPPCKIDDLGPIDVVLISHNHYDHLDLFTVKWLGNRPIYIVPDGHREWFKSLGIDRVIEMAWWNCYPLSENVNILCLPAQHWSKRTAFDDMHALWSGWAVVGSKKKLFFAGDTGYCSGFSEIGNKFGPFDLSLIPIGAYEPRDFMRCQHVDPVEAVQIHIDIKSKVSIGMHWGTWVLTDEHVYEPPQKLRDELQKRDMDQDCFFALNHGATYHTGWTGKIPSVLQTLVPQDDSSKNVTTTTSSSSTLIATTSATAASSSSSVASSVHVVNEVEIDPLPKKKHKKKKDQGDSVEYPAVISSMTTYIDAKETIEVETEQNPVPAKKEEEQHQLAASDEPKKEAQSNNAESELKEAKNPDETETEKDSDEANAEKKEDHHTDAPEEPKAESHP